MLSRPGASPFSCDSLYIQGAQRLYVLNAYVHDNACNGMNITSIPMPPVPSFAIRHSATMVCGTTRRIPRRTSRLAEIASPPRSSLRLVGVRRQGTRGSEYDKGGDDARSSNSRGCYTIAAAPGGTTRVLISPWSGAALDAGAYEAGGGSTPPPPGGRPAPLEFQSVDPL